jgi:hypothetical protein
MSDTFFCRKAEVQLKQLVDELYTRLTESRRLLVMYEADPDLDRRGYDKGYAQGIREEIGYLVVILDKYERS